MVLAVACGGGEEAPTVQSTTGPIERHQLTRPSYNNRGNAFNYLGQAQQAIQDYNEAIRLDPQLARAYSSRGNAYTELFFIIAQ